MAEAATIRMVTYLAPEVLDEIPVELVADWPAEDTCAQASAFLQSVEDPDERDLFRAEIRAFEADVLQVVRRNLLPFGDLIPFIHLGLGGSYQLVGRRGDLKIRIDSDLNIAIIRGVALDLEAEDKPRPLQLRHELSQVLPFAMASADRKPVGTSVLKDLSDVEPFAVYAELGPPEGSGYVNGRFSGLRAYSDGKVLLVGFMPTVLENTFQARGAPGTADESDSGFALEPEVVPPDENDPNVGPPPARGGEGWTEEDEARVQENLAAQKEQQQKGGAAADTDAGASEQAKHDEEEGGGAKGKAAGAATGKEGATEELPAEPTEEELAAMSPRERARAKRAAKKRATDKRKAAEREREESAASASDAAADDEEPPDPPLRLDENGELEDDEIDVGDWDAGKHD
ncbi:hypothetical protein ACFL59_06480 [Planctomycetota bacterium]